MLNDLAIQSARAFQSDETGFLHSFYGKKEAPHQAVSVQDNFLFALALCRLKTMEGVQEGKALLEKLLAYQNQEGLFPTYLHEFPHCFDRHSGVALLPILYSIQRHFHHVLGMGDRLKEAIDKLLTVSLKESSTLSLPNRFRLGGALVAFGKEGGHELLNMEGFYSHPSRFIPSHLGDMLSGALMAENGVTEELLKWMKSFWHPRLNCYAGPFNCLHFKEGKKCITLYDLYMVQETGLTQDKFKAPDLSLLKAALVFPLHHVERQEPVDAVFGNHFAYSWGNGQYPFAFQWGTDQHCLLFSESSEVQFDGKQLDIQLGVQKEERNELSVFFSQKPGMKILINGIPATTFRSGDAITIEDDTMKIQWIFEAKEGIFQGHLSKASLPTETQNFGTKRFNAYEWQLTWRSITRPDPCLVTLHFSYVSKI